MALHHFDKPFRLFPLGALSTTSTTRAPDFELSTRKGPEDVAQIGLVRVLDSME